jgi:nucleotide-binding universal stress UspA family protein
MFSKIFCPTDLSDSSFAAVKYAVDLCRRCDSKLVLLNVHEEFMNKDEMVMLRVSVEHFKDFMANRAVESKAKMEEVLQTAGGKDLDTELLLREGKATKEILETSEEVGADLIVITTSGRDSLGEKLLGSTAEHIIRYSKIPVLTIRV